MPFRVLKWGLKHPRLLVKAYTVFFILWTVFWIVVMVAIPIYYLPTSSYSESPSGLFLASLVLLLIFILPPFLPLYYYYRKSFKVSPKPPVAREEVLDPYLVSVREKFADAESYFRGEKVQWGPVIVDMFDAVMLALQRLVIDLKGVTPIEDLRKEKKLYFDVLANILDKKGVLKPEDRKELEILKDLRSAR